MTKSLVRAVLLAGATVLSVAAAPATAATLTYSDPNCAGFQITGSGGSFTLTCAKLQCSISGVTNPTTAVGTTLTANCTPPGASYLWNLVSGPFSDVSCQAPSTPTSATTAINKPSGIGAGQTKSCLYQVTGTAAPLAGQSMATVTWSDAPPSPPVCTPTAVTTPSPMISAGGTVALNANCAPSAGVTYTWTRTAPSAGAPTNATSATPSDTMAANAGSSAVQYTWQVVGCTSPTTCDTKTISASVPGSGGVSCSGFGKTIYVDANWSPNGTVWHTQDPPFNGFGPNDALVIHIKPPAGSASTINTAGQLNLAEFGDPAANRFAVLSTSSCSFSGTAGHIVPILYSGNVGVSVTPIQVNRSDFNSVNLQPGTDYYLNIKNTQTDGVTPSCSGSCNMIITWTKPPGT